VSVCAWFRRRAGVCVCVCSSNLLRCLFYLMCFHMSLNRHWPAGFWKQFPSANFEASKLSLSVSSLSHTFITSSSISLHFCRYLLCHLRRMCFHVLKWALTNGLLTACCQADKRFDVNLFADMGTSASDDHIISPLLLQLYFSLINYSTQSVRRREAMFLFFGGRSSVTTSGDRGLHR
jgi:hypothetical protein